MLGRRYAASVTWLRRLLGDVLRSDATLLRAYVSTTASFVGDAMSCKVLLGQLQYNVIASAIIRWRKPSLFVVSDKTGFNTIQAFDPYFLANKLRV